MCIDINTLARLSWYCQYINTTMSKRIFLQVELSSKEDRDAFKLWCQINNQDMAERVRYLIAKDIEEGKRLVEKLKGEKNNG